MSALAIIGDVTQPHELAAGKTARDRRSDNECDAEKEIKLRTKFFICKKGQSPESKKLAVQGWGGMATTPGPNT